MYTKLQNCNATSKGVFKFTLPWNWWMKPRTLRSNRHNSDHRGKSCYEHLTVLIIVLGLGAPTSFVKQYLKLYVF